MNFIVFFLLFFDFNSSLFLSFSSPWDNTFPGRLDSTSRRLAESSESNENSKQRGAAVALAALAFAAAPANPRFLLIWVQLFQIIFTNLGLVVWKGLVHSNVLN